MSLNVWLDSAASDEIAQPFSNGIFQNVMALFLRTETHAGVGKHKVFCVPEMCVPTFIMPFTVLNIDLSVAVQAFVA